MEKIPFDTFLYESSVKNVRRAIFRVSYFLVR